MRALKFDRTEKCPVCDGEMASAAGSLITFPSGRYDTVVRLRCDVCRIETSQTLKTSVASSHASAIGDRGEAA
jgi:hypothetical protein